MSLSAQRRDVHLWKIASFTAKEFLLIGNGYDINLDVCVKVCEKCMAISIIVLKYVKCVFEF